MTSLCITPANYKAFKRSLRAHFPDYGSSHLSESAAASLGFEKHSSLIAFMNNVPDGFPEYRLVDFDKFGERLSELEPAFARHPNRSDELWNLGFSVLEETTDTQPDSAGGIEYGSQRKKAWRNAMVAAINAGIEQRLFSLRNWDNRWAGAARSVDDMRMSPDKGATYSFEFIDGVSALAWVGNAGFGELTIHVALEPTGRYIRARNAGFAAGSLFAHGWLEREEGVYLQTSMSSGAIHCRRHLLGLAASKEIPTRGYGDRGAVIL